MSCRPIEQLNAAEKTKLFKKITAKKLDEAIPEIINLYQDSRDRGIDGSALRDLTSDLVTLFFNKMMED